MTITYKQKEFLFSTLNIKSPENWLVFQQEVIIFISVCKPYIISGKQGSPLCWLKHSSSLCLRSSYRRYLSAEQISEPHIVLTSSINKASIVFEVWILLSLRAFLRYCIHSMYRHSLACETHRIAADTEVAKHSA